MTDNQLKEQINTGNPAAFKLIYQRYYSGLCAYANRFINNAIESEEIVQASIFKLWEKRASINFTTSVVGYLFTSVRNNCLNYIKHQQIINRYNEVYLRELTFAEDSLITSSENGLSMYIANELEEKLNQAVEKLPANCREIFKLSRFEGLKHQEIAVMKGVTLNTVQKQISIALYRIRDELRDYI